LGLFFCLQFAVSVGEPPGLISLWYYLPATYQRWLALSGYGQYTLDWSFVTLLAFVLQLPAILRPPRLLRNAGAGYGVVDSASIPERKKTRQHQAIEVAAGDFLDSVVSVMVLLSDKIILIFIFVTGTLTADAPSLGYLLFSLYLLFDGTYDVTKSSQKWTTLARFNFAYLLLVVLYQSPFVDLSFGIGEYGLDWAQMAGLSKFYVGDPPIWNGNASWIGSVQAAVIMLLVDCQLRLYASSAYLPRVRYFREHLRLSAVRRRASTSIIRQRARRIMEEGLEEQSRRRAYFADIWKRINELVGAEGRFPDEEVWPNKPPDEGRDAELYSQGSPTKASSSSLTDPAGSVERGPGFQPMVAEKKLRFWWQSPLIPHLESLLERGVVVNPAVLSSWHSTHQVKCIY
jgi:hypothetical protein